MKRSAQELRQLLQRLLSHPGETQEFIDLFSIDDNWNRIDKNTPVPRGTGFVESECPECANTLRAIYHKFCSSDSYFSVICPHCQSSVGCHLEFTGYTCELHFEPYDVEIHSNQ